MKRTLLLLVFEDDKGDFTIETCPDSKGEPEYTWKFGKDKIRDYCRIGAQLRDAIRAARNLEQQKIGQHNA